MYLIDPLMNIMNIVINHNSPSAALTGHGHETQVESAAEESREKSHPGMCVSQWMF